MPKKPPKITAVIMPTDRQMKFQGIHPKRKNLKGLAKFTSAIAQDLFGDFTRDTTKILKAQVPVEGRKTSETKLRKLDRSLRKFNKSFRPAMTKRGLEKQLERQKTLLNKTDEALADAFVRKQFGTPNRSAIAKDATNSMFTK